MIERFKWDFFSEFEWIEMILHNLESNIQMNTITISSMIKLKNNQILSIIVRSLWNWIIDETTNWIIKQQHIFLSFKLIIHFFQIKSIYNFLPIWYELSRFSWNKYLWRFLKKDEKNFYFHHKIENAKNKISINFSNSTVFFHPFLLEKCTNF